VTPKARTVSEALQQCETRVREIAAAMSETGASDRLVGSLAKLGASAKDVEAVKNAWVDYTKASGLAAESSQWTREEAASVKAWETTTISSIRAVMAERRAEAAAMRTAAQEQTAAMRKGAEDQAAIRKETIASTKEMIASLGALMAGTGIIHGVEDVAKAAAALADVKNRLSLTTHGDQSEIQAVQGIAGDIATKFPGITQADALDTYLEIRGSSVGPNGFDAETARRNMTTMAETKTAMMALGMEFTPEDAQNLLKALEGSGRALDPKALGRITDAFIRASRSSEPPSLRRCFGTTLPMLRRQT
jgi:hypothetical protein